MKLNPDWSYLEGFIYGAILTILFIKIFGGKI